MPRCLFRAALITTALAAAASFALPSLAQRFDRNAKQDQAEEFDYYALVLSWSPTHCATPEGLRDQTQCNRRDGRQYDFILHGLWPQYNRGYPANCRTRFRPFVPQRTIDDMMDIMPSKGLIIHEYRKHGSCSGLTANDYYELSRELFSKVRIPAAFKSPAEPQMISPAELKDQFVAANRNLLKHDMLAVVCRGSGNRLREVRICFSTDGKPMSCGRNENQRSLCSAPRMFVPPVRLSPATARSPSPGKLLKPKSYPKSPLPMPQG